MATRASRGASSARRASWSRGSSSRRTPRQGEGLDAAFAEECLERLALTADLPMHDPDDRAIPSEGEFLPAAVAVEAPAGLDQVIREAHGGDHPLDAFDFAFVAHVV